MPDIATLERILQYGGPGGLLAIAFSAVLFAVAAGLVALTTMKVRDRILAATGPRRAVDHDARIIEAANRDDLEALRAEVTALKDDTERARQSLRGEMLDRFEERGKISRELYEAMTRHLEAIETRLERVFVRLDGGRHAK